MLDNARATLLLDDSQATGDLARLRKAIPFFRAAVAGTPTGRPGRDVYLANLGAALGTLFEHTGELDLLAEAVETAREAVAAASGTDHHATRLSNLGLTLHALGKRTGDLDAMQEAVKTVREAVAATPAGHPHLAGHLSNLSVVLVTLFERTGEPDLLTEAVEAGRRAVDATPAADRGRYSTNLGNALRLNFECTGRTELLVEAVAAAREALTGPAGTAHRCGFLTNLSTALLALGRRTGDLSSLREAVETAREAVADTPTGAPHRADFLSNLGLALCAQAERSGDAGLLAEAVEALREAVATTPTGHPHRVRHLSNLVVALRALYDRTGDKDLLVEAIDTGRQAVAGTPAGHPGRATYLSNLGVPLRKLFEHTGDAGLLAEATRCYTQAGGDVAARIAVRVNAYRQLARVAQQTDRGSGAALHAIEAAMALMPKLVPTAMARSDRERTVGWLASLAGEAASAALEAGRPERAVELLEQTRGILVADTVGARSSDLARLREAAPHLADAFADLRARLDALDRSGADRPEQPAAGRGPLSGPQSGPRELSEARQQAHAAWDRLMGGIRALDGFQDFLAAPSIDRLAPQAAEGPVVFVTTSPTRCDAIILVADDAGTPVRVVPLTALTEADAYQQANRLIAGRRRTNDPSTDPAARIAAQAEILDILAWLWDTVTNPVLNALGHTAAAGPADRQRIWWCPVGVLGYLPLHAAGHHGDLTAGDPALAANPRTVLDRVVSSYTPSLRGLAYARTQGPPAPPARTLIVAVPDAPGHPLPDVDAQGDALAALVPGSIRLPDPTRDRVLAELPAHAVAHFACHGHADPADPARSQLILRDHATASLTVADISALHLTGDLAYLAACDTTVTSLQLADEAVHLTGAFHLAGYRHVIGTLWPIDDTSARELAVLFYNRLTQGGTVPPETSGAPRALHQATRDLRARYPLTPSLWAAQTHTGA